MGNFVVILLLKKKNTVFFKGMYKKKGFNSINAFIQ